MSNSIINQKIGRRQIDITGQKFGRLTAINFVTTCGKNTYWLFKCDCGNEKIINKNEVTRKETKKHRIIKSCGCLSKEYKFSKFALTHGMSSTRFYSIWSGINDRCYGLKSHNYSRYGGKGIRNEWVRFKEFKKDMYESYSEHVKNFGEKQTTLDRIDNSKNYYKENCRWATYEEQNNNRVFKKK